MIDEGETDWKVMCIDIKDELADKINNLDDVENLKPGYVLTFYHVLTFLIKCLK